MHRNRLKIATQVATYAQKPQIGESALKKPQ